MMVLDTDHISILEHEDSPQAVALTKQLEALPKDEVATTAVTLEEQARSWLALIGRYSDVRQQVARLPDCSAGGAALLGRLGTSSAIGDHGLCTEDTAFDRRSFRTSRPACVPPTESSGATHLSRYTSGATSHAGTRSHARALIEIDNRGTRRSPSTSSPRREPFPPRDGAPRHD
jgi:hypothetical protein